MEQWLQSDQFWLVLTNVILGVSAVICAFVIVRIAIQEVHERKRIKSLIRHLSDDKTFVVSNLGVTMADGGKRIDDRHQAATKTLVVTKEGEILPTKPAKKD